MIGREKVERKGSLGGKDKEKMRETERKRKDKEGTEARDERRK